MLCLLVRSPDCLLPLCCLWQSLLCFLLQAWGFWFLLGVFVWYLWSTHFLTEILNTRICSTSLVGTQLFNGHLDSHWTCSIPCQANTFIRPILLCHVIGKVIQFGPRGSAGQGQSLSNICNYFMSLTILPKDASLSLRFIRLLVLAVEPRRPYIHSWPEHIFK